MTDARLYNLAYDQLLEDFVEVCECVLSHPKDEVKQYEKEILWTELVQINSEMRDKNIN
jgi:hypothetical protein